MQTLTVEITDESALKVLRELEEKHFIKILAKPQLESLALPGEPLSEEEFKEWVASRENGPTVSLKEAKAQWAEQRKQLQNLVK